jgi:hypothetical protein
MKPNVDRKKVFLSLLGGALLGSLALGPLFTSLAQPSTSGGVATPPPPQSNKPAGNEVAPPPSNIGTVIGLTYQGPPPSQVQKELVGPVLLLRAGKVDERAGTVTLPLYRGRMEDGRRVWYVLTDTTDRVNADALGLLHSAKLAYAAVGQGVRSARLDRNRELVFRSGTVDFSPRFSITPGAAPNFFPPKAAQPGSLGDASYSPLVRIENAGGHIYNAPIIAFDVSESGLGPCNGTPNHDRLHDKVLKVCAARREVTFSLVPGISFAKPVLYLSFDASDRVTATLEKVTEAPGLRSIPVGGDDGAFSAVERLFATVNGPMGLENPQRQGLNSALGDKGADGPFNLFGGIPTVATDYSPLWDVNVGQWTRNAVSRGYRSRMIDEFQYLEMVRLGHITGPAGKEFGSSGAIVNCPVVMRLL